MTYRVAARRFYWRWYGEVDLAGGPTLRLSGDAARWLRPGDEVRLQTIPGRPTPLLGEGDFALTQGRRALWPPYRSEVRLEHPGRSGGFLYTRRLILREAASEEDFEAIANLERYNGTRRGGAAALWRCPDGTLVRADEKPGCRSGSGRLLEVHGSSAASRFLILELGERDPAEPAVVGYLRVDPPLPVLPRRLGRGLDREARERVFPRGWFHPTFDLKKLLPAGRGCEAAVGEALDRLAPAAARVGRVVIHPDYRSGGLGTLLVKGGLQWIAERAVPDGRRNKELVCCASGVARYHPFLEGAGFRYLWDTVSGGALLAYPLSDAAVGRLRRFLQNDVQALEHRGRLYRSRYRAVSGLSGPVVFRDAAKFQTGLSDPDADGLQAVLRAHEGAGDLRRRILPRTTLRLRPGTVNVLWGTNEAGKHALLRLLWDELPDEGWVDVPPARAAAFIPGVAGPDPGKGSVLHNLSERMGDAAAAAELLQRLGLADVVAWRADPGMLPASQRERYRIALLLAARPDLLLLDDLAARQSREGGLFLARALARLVREAGMTLIASTAREEVRRALEPDNVIYVGYDEVWQEPGR